MEAREVKESDLIEVNDNIKKKLQCESSQNISISSH